MDFIEDSIDQGAPEYNVTGIASIERISAGQIRETYYSQRKDGAIVAVHVVWDLQAWVRHRALVEQATEIILRMTPTGPDQERRRERPLITGPIPAIDPPPHRGRVFIGAISRAIRLLVYRGLAHVGIPLTEAVREVIR